MYKCNNKKMNRGVNGPLFFFFPSLFYVSIKFKTNVRKYYTEGVVVAWNTLLAKVVNLSTVSGFKHPWDKYRSILDKNVKKKKTKQN